MNYAYKPERFSKSGLFEVEADINSARLRDAKLTGMVASHTSI
jgi:hypothetical protein